MKIAVIVRRLNVKGGTQRHALSLAHEFRRNGHDVRLYTFLFSPPDCYEALLEGFDVTVLGRYPSSRNIVVDMIREHQAAKELALRIDPATEILNPHDQVSYRVAYYFKKKVAQVPSVWTMNDLPTYGWGRWREQQVNPEARSFPAKYFLHWVLDRYEIATAINAQDVVAVLDWRDQRWVKEFFDKEAVVVRSGIVVDHFPYRQRRLPRDGNVRLLMSGIFSPHRRFEDAIEAVHILRERRYGVTLSIIGDYTVHPSYLKKIRLLIARRELEGTVHFLGKVTEEDLVAFYHGHEIFLLPSHLQSWGIAVFEAMATGLPVVVSRSAGAHEVLTDGENSILVNPCRPEELAAAVIRLIEDSELYQRLSRTGRILVEDHISSRQTAAAMETIFRRLLSQEKK